MRQGRVLVYTDAHTEGATYQIRVAAPLGEAHIEVLQAEDVDLTSIPRILHEDIDALVIHRGIRKRCRMYGLLVDAARDSGKPVIYDVDDLLIDVPASHPDFPIYQSRALGALKVLLDADLVVASTRTLAEQLQAFHSNVTVIQNRLPRGIWSGASVNDRSASLRGEDGRVTIGYIGTPTHAADLESMEESLLTVLDNRPGDVRFVAIGVAPSVRLKTHPAVEHWVPPKKSQKDYAAFAAYARQLPIDIGVAPLIDTLFNRCKSDIKFHEYTALGVPGVYSDVTPYSDSVIDGQTGLLASDAAGWTAAILKLVDSEPQRRAMATAARMQLEGNPSSNSETAAWGKALQQGRQLVRDPVAGLQRTRAAGVMDHLFAYQADLERQLKRTAGYQIGKAWQRFLRKIA